MTNSIFSIFFLYIQYTLSPHTLRKKRYKICHWGCTFSKGQLLSILGANMYILGQVVICTFRF